MKRLLIACLIAASLPVRADVPLEKIQIFAEVFERIRAIYVQEVSDEQLLDSAIRGMLLDLDPHSSYLPPAIFDGFQAETSGQFGGLGMEVAAENGVIRVVTPIDDTPAFEAGIQAGDLIVAIDDTDVRGMDLGQAIELLRGPVDSEVTLTLVRGNGEQQLTLTRALISVASVRGNRIGDDFGWVRISQFQQDTGDETRALVKRLNDQAPLKGLVLDLRNNPGGVLGAAIGVSDVFVETGTIASTRTRNAEQAVSFNARNQDGDFIDLPLVVLINEGSASASEIVAGALQDLGRAVIMGTPSFGKGSVQSLLPLADGSALKLTTALYYTPNDRSIQNEGIVPDVLVRQGTLTVDDNQSLREADLAGRLDNPAGDAEPTDDRAAPVDDYQLQEAINMLRGLAVVTRK